MLGVPIRRDESSRAAVTEMQRWCSVAFGLASEFMHEVRRPRR